MLVLPVARATTMVVVHPHYPENVGAAARAMKTMGITGLILVKPSRIAVPEHEMARKMAVKSLDVLDGAARCRKVEEALGGVALSFATTSRRGVSGVLSPRRAAEMSVAAAAAGKRVAFALCTERVRIPMAADQPSINLAQAIQIIAYELFVTGLAAKEAGAGRASPA